MKLGKLPPRFDRRTFRLADFVSLTLPAAAPARNWDWALPDNTGYMGNDVYGDCGFAGQGHAIQTWSSANGLECTVTDAAVIAAYSGCTGFNPALPSTDNGVVLLDALNYWRQTGIGGHKIGAYVKVDTSRIDHVQLAIGMFGGLYLGAALPTAAQKQSTWTAPPGTLTGPTTPGSWGGHCMWCPAYDRTGVQLRTWGKLQRATWDWFTTYVDECYALVSSEWVTDTKAAPSGFDSRRLQSYLAAL